VAPLSPRIRRVLEHVYGVEGVLGVRVTEFPGEGGAVLVAIGVRVAPTENPHATLRRVEQAVAHLRQPGETWELGLLGDEPLEEPSAA
jgi:hypothetical protein